MSEFTLTSVYMQRKRKLRKGVSHSMLSLLRRELQEGTLQSLFGGFSCIGSSTSAAPDPLLSSFILPMSDDFISTPSQVPSETSSAKKISDEKIIRRYALILLPFLFSFSFLVVLPSIFGGS